MNVDSVTLDKFGTGGSSLSDESLQVNFVISEPASLIRFMDSISQRHHTTEWLHDWYFAHRGGDTSKDRKLIEDYRKMMDTAGGEFIDESGRPQDLNQRLITVAAQCNGMPDFLPKIKGLMKANEYTKLKGILEHFDPIFRALVWEQRYSALESQLKEYQHWAVKSKLSERLLEVKRFLKAPWVKGLPFTIVLVPLPKPDIKKAGTHGESLGKVQLVELLPESDFQDFADVVFHEMCHALWHTRKDLETVRHDFEKAGNYVAYAELDEGMATALGQGWFSKMAFGKTPKNWYTDQITNGYSHALYPIVKDYLKKEKSIDEEFARKAVEVFKKHFPNAGDSMEMTSYFEIYSDGMGDMTTFHNSLRKALPRLKSLSMSSPIANAESISSFRNSGNKHSAVLISKAKLPDLNEWGIPIEKIEYLKTVREPVMLKIGEKEVIFCIADNPPEQQRLLFEALSQKKWPKEKK